MGAVARSWPPRRRPCGSGREPLNKVKGRFPPATHQAVRSAVHRRGVRFRVSVRPEPELPRTADLVLRKSRVAVFVDGCYWHGCPEHRTQPATNPDYWADKIAHNIERDAETTDYLQQAGWMVLRFWEHEDPESVADRVQESVRAALRNETNPGIRHG